MTIQWQLGALDLTDSEPGGPFWFETLAEGWDLGSPEAVKAVFASLAADGDDERVTRHGNRQVGFRVTVCAPDSIGLRAGERALGLELAKRNELRMLLPDRLGGVTVIDVLTAAWKYVPDDLDLTRKTVRATYEVTLTCKPFTRPTTPTTTSLSFTSVAPTTINPATSTVGVTGSTGAAALTLSPVTYLTESAIKGTPASPYRGLGWDDPVDVYSFASVSLPASHPFLAVDVAFDPGLWFRQDQFSVVVSSTTPGLTSTPVGFDALGNGFRRYYFPHTLAGSTIPLKVNVRMQRIEGPSQQTAASYIGGLYAAPAAPSAGMVVAQVGGSQRSPASVSIAKATSGSLGQTIVFADPAMMTYGYNPSVSATWANAPAGTYMAVMPASGSTAGNVYGLTINGQTSFTRAKSTSETLVFEFNLGARRDGLLGALSVSGTVNGSAWGSLPSFYLFRDAAETAMVWLPNVTQRYLWIDAPTLERPEVGIWAGASSNGSDAVSVVSSALSADPLMVVPPLYGLWINTAAQASADVNTAVTYYELSHTFAGKLAS